MARIEAGARLALAMSTGQIVLPDGPLIVIGAPAGYDFGDLKDRATVLHWDAVAIAAHQAARIPVAHWPGDGDFAAAVVVLPRARALARALIAAAARLTRGPIYVDGAKTDGVDSLHRDLRKRADAGSAWSKAHGKVFTIAPGQDFSDWAEARQDIEGGYQTLPGIFSADSVDRASALLAEALPTGLSGAVADLGAGWGYLSSRALSRCPGITRLHLVEADSRALDCARDNVTDSRADFHWANALNWTCPDGRLDAIICNPPFHVGRAADPGLGRAFITASARLLSPQGQLWLVANRHLPYEETINGVFSDVTEAGGDGGFKILAAKRPRKAKGRR